MTAKEIQMERGKEKMRRRRTKGLRKRAEEEGAFVWVEWRQYCGCMESEGNMGKEEMTGCEAHDQMKGWLQFMKHSICISL